VLHDGAEFAGRLAILRTAVCLCLSARVSDGCEMLQKMLFFCERAETDWTEYTARLLSQVVCSRLEGVAFVSRFDMDQGVNEQAGTPPVKASHQTSELVVCV
jgi:hypothetical protein